MKDAYLSPIGGLLIKSWNEAAKEAGITVETISPDMVVRVIDHAEENDLLTMSRDEAIFTYGVWVGRFLQAKKMNDEDYLAAKEAADLEEE